ncbi:tripartite tricarboxylate transporter TctB family protein [Marinobacter sp.]|uniref:tripartite tricarboxylate transporter TctB family protein n=1 Tax=Marinobacter sp. TaxID=50741 RepID=UPI001B5CE80B|nr:tripartite tricarboxylate transporter TctB family protein [Marinobacter sp.]MBQ0833125.1 tripartite tricarboxylate transporter TctB family protein [Marinobacter sp.]
MRSRLPATHAVLLGLIMGTTAFVLWSSTQASTKLQNLVVLVPVSVVLVLACVAIVAVSLRHSPSQVSETEQSEEPSAEASIWGDVILLAGFGLFCVLLTRIGFDLATFLFVWGGVVLSGGKGLWQPPLFAAIFTVVLVYGFGSLFPYPMETMVL